MKGYKVFNPDWTCKGFQYEVGKTYKMDDEPVPCHKGFHFCERVADCFSYYAFDPQNKVAEIEALGKIVKDGDKFCTNEIKIVREVPWEEMLTLANSGHENTGYSNSGDCNSGHHNSGVVNSGDHNSGDFNSGDYNSGSRNFGDCNSGDRNFGDCNSGDYNSRDYNSGAYNSGEYNSGDHNSGDRNSGNGNSGDANSGNHNLGNWNSGDYNKTNHSSGCFCTEEPKILFFDKKTDWTYKTWEQSRARFVLKTMPHHVENKYIIFSDMTDEEKRQYPEAKTIGGYIKNVETTYADRQKWWDNLTEDDKAEILALPNFDAEKFRMITGIVVDGQSPSNYDDEDEGDIPFFDEQGRPIM